MKKRVPDKFWFPWWPGKWIFGSVRIEFSPAERGIWVDLLSFASMDDGHIRANEDTPYLLQQLSGMLIIPEKELEAAINKFIKNKKLTKLKSGTLYVTKWEKYQFSDRHKRRIEDSVEPQENEDEIFYKTAIRCPEAFFDMANKSGTVRVNRLIVAIILGRSLEPEEEVHHINKKENDNKPENLMLFADHEDHGKYEHGFKIEPIWDGSKLSKTAKTAIVAKIKAAIIYNSTLNNNKINNNTYTEEFSQFWDYYNFKIAKQDTLKAFKALRRKGVTQEQVMEAAKGYFNHLKNEKVHSNFEKSMMYPATFLRNDKWKDFIGVTYNPPM